MRGRTLAGKVTARTGRGRGVHRFARGEPGFETLAPERKRAEIRTHPFGCLERRSSIQQAELDSFQPRTPSSRGLGRGECPCRDVSPGSYDGRDASRFWGSNPFGLKLSVSHPTRAHMRNPKQWTLIHPTKGWGRTTHPSKGNVIRRGRGAAVLSLELLRVIQSLRKSEHPIAMQVLTRGTIRAETRTGPDRKARKTRGGPLGKVAPRPAKGGARAVITIGKVGVDRGIEEDGGGGAHGIRRVVPHARTTIAKTMAETSKLNCRARTSSPWNCSAFLRF